MFLKLINVYSALVHLSINNNNNYHYYSGGSIFTAFQKKMTLHLLIKYIIVYLTDFWKTNLTKFAVIYRHLTEKASKGRFLKPENGSKITVTKEKERRKRKSEEISKGGEEKKAMVTL